MAEWGLIKHVEKKERKPVCVEHLLWALHGGMLSHAPERSFLGGHPSVAVMEDANHFTSARGLVFF